MYVDERSGVYRVSLVYRSDDASSAEEEVGLFLTQFLARPDIDVAVKQVGPGTSVEHLTVAGQPGFWITGEPHALAYLDESGRMIEDRVRLVGDVLLNVGDTSSRQASNAALRCRHSAWTIRGESRGRPTNVT